KIIHLQFMVERSCKSSADQKIELLIFEKLSNAFPADVFTDTRVNDFDCAMVNRAANHADALLISVRFISEPAQEFRALGRQGERHRNHFFFASVICTMKLFFSPVAGVGDPGLSPPMDAIAARNSDSRLAERSTRMLRRPASGTPFVADPPSSETIATTLSATASSFPVSAGIVISVT